MRLFIKYRIADFVLVTCIALSIAMAVCSGFLLNDEWYTGPVAPLIIIALETALLIFLSKNKKGVLIGIGIGVLALIAAVVFMRQNNAFLDETANSLFIVVFVSLVSGVAVYLLTRSKAGLIVMFAAFLIVVVGALFLEFPLNGWAVFLFVISCALLFLYRVYTVSAKHARLGKIRPFSYIAQSAAVCAAAALVSFGVFYLVVAPLNPPTMELKLIEDLKSFDILKVLGISTVREVLDTSLQSESETSDIEEDNDEADESEAETESAQAGENDGSGGSETENKLLFASPVDYFFKNPNYLWFLLIIPAALCAVFAARVLLKRRWHKRVSSLPKRDVVFNYYRFFMSRLSKAGAKRLPSKTCGEFTKEQSYKLQAFKTENTDFKEITEIYEKTYYGGIEPSEGELKAYEDFYSGFYKRLRKEVGTFKYYIWVFRF